MRMKMGLIVYEIIAWTLVVLCAAMIFSFSGQDGDTSSALSMEVTDVVARFVAPDEAGRDNPSYEALHHGVRKGAHMAVYALWAMLLMAALAPLPFPLRRKLLLALIVCILYASADESHQGFVEGRGMAATDVLIDSLGALLGLCAGMLARAFVLWVTRHGVIRAGGEHKV